MDYVLQAMDSSMSANFDTNQNAMITDKKVHKLLDDVTSVSIEGVKKNEEALISETKRFNEYEQRMASNLTRLEYELEKERESRRSRDASISSVIKAGTVDITELEQKLKTDESNIKNNITYIDYTITSNLSDFSLHVNRDLLNVGSTHQRYL